MEYSVAPFGYVFDKHYVKPGDNEEERVQRTRHSNAGRVDTKTPRYIYWNPSSPSASCIGDIKEGITSSEADLVSKINQHPRGVDDRFSNTHYKSPPHHPKESDLMNNFFWCWGWVLTDPISSASLRDNRIEGRVYKGLPEETQQNLDFMPFLSCGGPRNTQIKKTPRKS
ncbi:hypothetical protein BGW36DRAFT_386756 [Talaromyces proteolyticus]|uniref:Uncharacterized protein n=1 Tax=Talaromyces proteolyticus TaxID=1131652 RepID=A0AAD4KHN6_9EURO|nr:uncharacterized protein BGW36DRAFT_386756 [Talaromyces proteolyticus]KAH8691995.1 hypothetical protein BGW36DRAFT_386756 [Talaromyces proteolyticus]